MSKFSSTLIYPLCIRVAISLFAFNTTMAAQTPSDPIRILVVSEQSQTNLLVAISEWLIRERITTIKGLDIANEKIGLIDDTKLKQIHEKYDWMVVVGEKSLDYVDRRVERKIPTVVVRSHHQNHEQIRNAYIEQRVPFYSIVNESSTQILSTIASRLFPLRNIHGIIISENKKYQKNEFDKWTTSLGHQPYTLFLRTSDNPLLSFERLVQNADVIIATKYTNLYDEEDLKNYLLTAFHYQIPVIGSSQSFTQLGAVAAVDVSDTLLVNQFMPWIMKSDISVPESQWLFIPKKYRLSLNYNRLKEFNIDVTEADILRDKLINGLPFEEAR